MNEKKKTNTHWDKEPHVGFLLRKSLNILIIITQLGKPPARALKNTKFYPKSTNNLKKIEK